MDSSLVLFNGDLTLEIRKTSHGARSSEYGGLSNTDLVLCQKQCCVLACCLGRVVSLSSTFQVVFSHTLTKPCENLFVVDLVNNVSFRYAIHVNNPSGVKKEIIVALNLDVLCRAFFCQGFFSSAWISALLKYSGNDFVE